MQEETMGTKYPHGDTSWFVKDRFGLFIHWGTYALAARHEWIRNIEQITQDDYQKYFNYFNPDLFEPEKWARIARDAGMKYFIITTKHHEGFCLWDTQYTDYKITNTPFGRDALREIVNAFRAEGLKVGFYYSLIDWHHPEFPVDRHHPQCNDIEYRDKNKNRDVHKYAQYMRDQVRELLTGFGKVDILWFDYSYPGIDGKGHKDWESEKMVAMIRDLQPHIILNNRLDLPGANDIMTPEQYVPASKLVGDDGKFAAWEGCHTFSGSWGYYRDETSWKPPKMLLELLIDHVSKDGNLLMNVGPTARGVFDQRALDSLKVYGDWLYWHGRAIYGCGAAPENVIPPAECRYTYNAETNRLYVHFFSWPFKAVHLPDLAGKVQYAQLLNDASEIKMGVKGASAHASLNPVTPPGALTLELPVVCPNVEIPVIELILKEKL